MKEKTFDLVIQGGRVLDPRARVDGIYSVGIDGCRVAALSQAPLSGRSTVDATGCLVTPGLIDFHTHLFSGGSALGLPPDLMLSQGVTAAVDAGTSGSAGFEAFVRGVIRTSLVTVKVFVSLGATGLSDPGHHQDYRRDRVNVARLRELKELYPDTLLGLKVSLGREDVGPLGLEPLRTAVELAEELGELRVCVHSTDPPCDSDELLALLRPGDILCHCYHGTGPGILDTDGRVQDSYWRARRRGVLFDMANGHRHFSHRSAVGALEAGFPPDIVSTDLVAFAYGRSRRNRSLVYVMSKLLAMGIQLNALIRAVTETPARLMGLAGKIGTLAPGAFADLTVLSLEPREVDFEDADMAHYRGETLLCPQMTVKNGRVVFVQHTFNL